MAAHGQLRRRLIWAIALTGLIPLLAGVVYAQWLLRQASERFFLPEVGQQLEKSPGLYQEVVRATKDAMRQSASSVARNPQLLEAWKARRPEQARRALKRELGARRDLVSLELRAPDGSRWVEVNRGKALDPKLELALEVLRPLGGLHDAETEAGLDAGVDDTLDEQPVLGALDELLEAEGARLLPEQAQLVALFAARKELIDGFSETTQFVDTYRKIEGRRDADTTAYVRAFAVLLLVSIVIAIVAGNWIARGATRRITKLAEAVERAGAGDLETRVPEEGSDELTELAKAFNRMLTEIETTRSRIEYLQRIEAWQEMARRLAHEIKNPLTPIQLAVQDIHRRYDAANPGYQKLLDTTLEIVEDEVATLRRLVTEFSGFARLPQPRVESAELGEFLAEQRLQLSLVEEDSPQELGDRASGEGAGEPFVELQLPNDPAKVLLDRQLFRRVLINLVRNAVQAAQAEGTQDVRVRLAVHRQGDFWVLDVEDNGPGIEPEMRSSIFDPYVTTKTDGTGLGLAIVKKIVVDHGGTVTVLQSELGGACVRLSLPEAGTVAARAVSEGRGLPPPSSRRGSV